MEKIYFDHAATTPLDKGALEKMLPYYTEIFGNPDSPHFFGRKAQGAVDSARDKIASLLNAKPSEIYFTSGGTESDNWAFLGGARAKKKDGRDKVVLTAIEHHALLSAAQTLESEGFEVCFLPVDKDGKVCLKTAQERIDERTAIVACMAANNETGVIQPYREVVEYAKKMGALTLVDGVQLAPYQRIDVKEVGADMFSISAHKFYGPKGVGVLYIKSGVKIEKLIVGGEQERGLRGGTSNVPNIVGMAYAYEKCVRDMDENNEKIERVKNKFVQAVTALDGAHINGESKTGVVSVRFDGIQNTSLLYSLDLEGIAAAAGSACASQSIKPSHVLMAMGLSEKQTGESLRFSFGKDNTEEEVEKAVAVLKKTIDRIR